MTSVSYAYDDLMNPVIRALKLLGGSGTNEEINDKVAELLKIPAEQLEILHNPEKGGMTEIEYRLMWTRTYLKRYGVIANSTRGVWALTAKGSTVESVDEKDVVRVVRAQLKKDKQEGAEVEEEPNKKIEWQEELLDQHSENVPFWVRAVGSATTTRVWIHPGRGHRTIRRWRG